ncbi:MAG: orotidine-5'-phosphate decarboxylase [Verrucomicrobiota bacterium]|nr:orotidine-5'-phosphate decarboxylase [Verrucomicrobiota bacterium]
MEQSERKEHCAMENNSAGPIIVALDVPSEEAAIQIVNDLTGLVGLYKIGLQLFTKCGPRIVTGVKATGAKVFLDLKFHDIPNTVANAVQSACALGVDMLTIHLSGGSKMIRAAVDAAENTDTIVLGVTVLTSSTQESLREVSVAEKVQDQVLRLARLGIDNGLRGIVASPNEAALLREALGPEVIIVTPGVRARDAAADDQARTLTPKEAIAAGANYLVIGRPIIAQENPRQAVEAILAEIGKSN